MKRVLLLLLLLTAMLDQSRAQKKKGTTAAAVVPAYDASLYSGMQWRQVGPFRGGRAGTATGVKGKPNLYYFGSAGSGV